MFIDPYDTTACSAYKPAVEKIKIEIKKNDLLGNLGDFKAKLLKPGIIPITGKTKDIPPFSHPVITNTNTIYFDVRGFTRVLPNGDVVITAVDEFNFHYMRALLTQHSLTNSIDDLRTVSTFPLTVFSSWLGETISRSLSLNIVEQIRVNTIIGIYYISLFKDSRELADLSEKDRIDMAGIVARACSVDLTIANELVEVLSPMQTIEDLVENLRNHAGSIRFNNFSLRTLLNMVRNGWVGANSTEIVYVALESPITFISIVATALQSKGYSKIPIGRIVDRWNRQQVGSDFLKALHRLPGISGN